MVISIERKIRKKKDFYCVYTYGMIKCKVPGIIKAKNENVAEKTGETIQTPGRRRGSRKRFGPANQSDF